MTPSHDEIEPRLAALAEQYEFSHDAVRHLLKAIHDGGGAMAMFDHPGLRGPGQWMHGGLLMTSAPGDHRFNERVRALCDALAALSREYDDDPGAIDSGSSAQGWAWRTPAGGRQRWWPADWGTPSVTGSQGEISYALFSDARCFAIRHGDTITRYDTEDHHVTGIALSQQGANARVVLTTPSGELPLAALTPCEPAVAQSGAPAAKATPTPTADRSPPDSADILQTIERLGTLHAQGLLTDEEFTTKKRELLDRL